MMDQLRPRVIALLLSLIDYDDLIEMDDPHYCLPQRAEIETLLEELKKTNAAQQEAASDEAAKD